MRLIDLTRWIIRRVIVEETHGLVLSILLSAIMVSFVPLTNLKSIIHLVHTYGSEIVKYLSNISIFTGTLIGFLASISVVAVLTRPLSMDRLSRFIEIVLSGPFTFRQYLIGIVLSCIILSIIVDAILVSVYAAALYLEASEIITLMVNAYTIITGILITIFSSLLTITLHLTFARLSYRFRGGALSIIPSLLLYLLILFVFKPLSTTTPLWTVLYAIITVVSVSILIMIVLIFKLMRPEILILYQ